MIIYLLSINMSGYARIDNIICVIDRHVQIGSQGTYMKHAIIVIIVRWYYWHARMTINSMGAVGILGDEIRNSSVVLHQGWKSAGSD